VTVITLPTGNNALIVKAGQTCHRNRELEQRRRRRRGRRLVKMNLYFSGKIRNFIDLFSTLTHANGFNNALLRLNIQWHRLNPNGNTNNCNWQSSTTLSRRFRTLSFHVNCCFASFSDDGKEMPNKDSPRICTAIVLLIKPFVWWHSRCCRRRGLLKGSLIKS